MSAIRGYPTQQKLARNQVQFVTVEPVHKEQNGLSVLAHQFVYQVATDTAEAGSTSSIIVATGHSALEGDVIRITSGDLSGREYKVQNVLVDSITLCEDLPVAVAAGVTFGIFRHRYPAVEPTGEVKISGSFTATEEAVSPDGGALPAKVKVTAGYDGTAVQVLKTDAAGELQIDVLSSALPTGAATEATLQTIDADTGVLAGTVSGGKVLVDGSGVTQPISAASLPLPTGAATSAKQPALGVSGTASADVLTVQGIAGMTPVGVSATSLPLPTGAATEATLSAMNAKIPALAASGGIPVEVLQQDGLLDAGNTTAAALGAGAAFTGTWKESINFAGISLGVFSDRASATNGVDVQFSSDGVTVHHHHYYTYAGASIGIGYAFATEFRYFRIVYTNNSIAQTTFRLITVLKASAIQPSQYRLTNALSDETQASVTRSLIFGKTTGGGGGYVDVKVNPSGALVTDTTGTVAATQSGTWNITNVTGTVSLPTGAATETTLSGINGKLPALSGGSIPVTFTGNSVVDLLDANILDTSSTNIAGSAASPTQVVASLAAAVKAMQILDTTGAFIGLYTGPSGSEVLRLIIGPGSDQTIDHAIPSATRISLKRLDSTTAISSGIVAINFLG
jgi:hypothetical protein